MSQPTSSDVHIDQALTDMSIAYMQSDTNYIAGRVFPSKPSDKKTNKYHIFNKNDWFRDDAVLKRAPNQGAPRSGFTLSNDNFDCEPFWTAVPLSELVSANADAAVPMDEAGMRLVTQRMLINRDRQFATAYIDTDSVWDTDKTVDTQWNDAASDPEKDITDGRVDILKNTGLEPNTLVVSYEVHQVLKRHPLIKDRYKHTTAESITTDLIARFFEIERYFVSKSVYATNAEGGTAAYDFTTGKHALLAYVDMSPNIMTPTAAVNFIWSGLTQQNDLGVRIDQFFDSDKKEDVVRGEFAFDMKVTGTDLGYRFKDVIA